MNEKAFREFALAGDAHFTALSNKTGDSYEFRVYHLPLEKSTTSFAPWFVYYVKNDKSIFIGTIKSSGGICWWSRKSDYKYKSDVVQAFIWIWKNRFKGWMNKVQIMPHACGRCGRKLTDVNSIRNGLGPICAKKTREVS